MKLTAIPLFDKDSANGEEVLSFDDLKPKAFVDLLDRHKALIFRSGGDDAVLTPDDFGQFVCDLQLERYPYVGGAAPRTIIPTAASKDAIVFTANERYVILMISSSTAIRAHSAFHLKINHRCLFPALPISPYPSTTSSLRRRTPQRMCSSTATRRPKAEGKRR